MIDSIKICYIDDDIDLVTTRYLRSEYENEKADIEYNESIFCEDDTYETLLKKEEIREADILILDSKLFKEAKAGKKIISGEELSIILKLIYPYKEMIVITQNDIDGDVLIMKKFDSHSGKEAADYFQSVWKPVIDKAVLSILSYRSWIEKIEDKKSVEQLLMEQIRNSIEGNAEYARLTVGDLDKLVSAFKQMKEDYEK